MKVGEMGSRSRKQDIFSQLSADSAWSPERCTQWRRLGHWARKWALPRAETSSLRCWGARRVLRNTSTTRKIT